MKYILLSTVDLQTLFSAEHYLIGVMALPGGIVDTAVREAIRRGEIGNAIIANYGGSNQLATKVAEMEAGTSQGGFSAPDAVFFSKYEIGAEAAISGFSGFAYAVENDFSISPLGPGPLDNQIQPTDGDDLFAYEDLQVATGERNISTLDLGGGTDTIDFGALTRDQSPTSDEDGTTVHIGSRTYLNVERLVFADGVVVLDVGGDPGPDVPLPGDADITGTGGADTIMAVDGDTSIDGGGGSDTVIYQGVRSEFSATLAADGTITVTKPDGSTDTLLSIERTSFAEGDLIFDLPSANAPAAYRLYGGAFDRIPDEGGLRFWINAVDAGLSLRDAAAGFIDSPEFGALYGTGLSNAAFIGQLYLNVLGRPGEADGVTFWNTYLDGGGDRAETLVQFTQLPEYVGLSQADIENGYWVG